MKVSDVASAIYDASTKELREAQLQMNEGTTMTDHDVVVEHLIKKYYAETVIDIRKACKAFRVLADQSKRQLKAWQENAHINEQMRALEMRRPENRRRLRETNLIEANGEQNPLIEEDVEANLRRMDLE